MLLYGIKIFTLIKGLKMDGLYKLLNEVAPLFYSADTKNTFLKVTHKMGNTTVYTLDIKHPSKDLEINYVLCIEDLGAGLSTTIYSFVVNSTPPISKKEQVKLKLRMANNEMFEKNLLMLYRGYQLVNKNLMFDTLESTII